MKQITFEELQAMSDEEVRALNKKMAIRGFVKLATLFTAKWAIIILVNRQFRKAYVAYTESEQQ